MVRYMNFDEYLEMVLAQDDELRREYELLMKNCTDELMTELDVEILFVE